MLLIFSLMGLSVLKAQDTIVFADGRVKTVDVQLLDSLGNLNYLLNGKYKTVNKTEVIEYTNEGQWYKYNKETGDFSPINHSEYILYGRFFDDTPSYSYGRFSVATNLVSPFIYSDFKSIFKANVVASNPIISIEPAYAINKYWAIKLPFYYGFNLNAPQIIEEEATNTNEYNDFYQGQVRLTGRLNSYSLPNSVGDGVVPSISPIQSSSPWQWPVGRMTHVRDLRYQIGICPKFYPFGQKSHAVFIQQSFILGIADHYQVDYYINFDTLHIQVEEGVLIQWNLYGERAVQKNSPALFFRYEAITGVELNITRNWNFSTEIGISTQPKNTGEADRFYFQYKPGTDYQLVQTKVFEFRSRLYPIARVHLIYKFGGIKL